MPVTIPFTVSDSAKSRADAIAFKQGFPSTKAWFINLVKEAFIRDSQDQARPQANAILTQAEVDARADANGIT